MIAWIIFFVYLEIYSVGVAVLAKRNGENKWYLNLIPFVSCFYIDRYLGGFKILTIPVKKWGKLLIWLVVICVLATIYAMWGINNLQVEGSAEALVQIMLLPISVCAFIFWVGTATSATDILFKNGVDFKYSLLVCLLLIPVPFLFVFLIGKKKKIVKTI